MTTSNPVLVEVMRGSTVESVHRGALAVLDADGVIACAADHGGPAGIGRERRPTHPGSAAARRRPGGTGAKPSLSR